MPAYQLLADIILLIHALFVAFIVFGALLTPIGARMKWRWVRLPWFRWIHLGGIVFVVGQSWLGKICPLTTLEMKLRLMAGSSLYEGGFIQHWLQQILYFAAPAWVFTAAYSIFGVLVALNWVLYPPSANKR